MDLWELQKKIGKMKVKVLGTLKTIQKRTNEKKYWKKEKLVQLATRAPMLYIKYIFHFLFSICNVTCQPGNCSLFVAQIFRLRTNFTGKKYRHKYRHKHTRTKFSLSSWFSFFIFFFFVSITKWTITLKCIFAQLNKKHFPWKNGRKLHLTLPIPRVASFWIINKQIKYKMINILMEDEKTTWEFSFILYAQRIRMYVRN